MAKDACVASTTEIRKIEDNLIFQQQQQPCGSVSSVFKQDESKESSFFLSFPKECQEDVHDNPDYIAFKRIRCSCQTDCRIRENQEVGLQKGGGVLVSTRRGRVDLCDSVEKEFLSLPVAKAEVFEVGSALISRGGSEKTVNDVNKVQVAANEGCVNGVVGDMEIERSLESRKKQVSAAFDIGSIFKETSSVQNADSEGILGFLKGIGNSVRSSLKIEVIDDTALVIPVVPVPKTGFSGANVQHRYRQKNNVRQETDRKQAIVQPRRKGKSIKKSMATNERQKKAAQVGETRNKIAKLGKQHNGTTARENGDGIQRKYTREVMESLRFMNIVEQRRMWRHIYNSLGNGVAVEYDDLKIAKHQKNIRLNYDPLRRVGRKEGGPGIIARGRWSDLNIAVH